MKIIIVKYTFSFVAFFLFTLCNSFAQTAIVSSGGEASFGEGYTSYSIGQLDYAITDNISEGVQQSYSNAPFIIPAKLPQSITGFNTFPLVTVGGVYNIRGVSGGGSGNPVMFTASDTSLVNIIGNLLVPLNTGVVSITASQLGNANYLEATPVTQILTITGNETNSFRKLQAIIGLPALIILGVADEYILNGTTTSALPISYTIRGESVSFSGNNLVALASGNAILIASQSGNSEYLPAPSISIPIIVTAAGVNSTVSGIIGKETVIPTLETTYKQVLTGDGYTYSWKYTGGKLNFSGDSTASTVKLSFPENSQPGQLINYVYDANGNLVDYTVQDIHINTVTSAKLTLQLEEVKCEQKASDCSNNYINSFKLGKKSYFNSGCSPSGYGDFTATGNLDSLLMGDAYDAQISSFSSSTSAYFGIWIDYDNNGSFNDPGEFVGSSLASDTVFTIANLLIRNDPEFVGPKRLRIKMQTSGQVTSIQSCSESSGNGGETEDYMIFLEQTDRLKAPNIITPNNDGKNDLFVIRGINTKKSNKLVVVNRWGEKLFEKLDYENDWDGKDSHNNNLPRGTYFYFFSNGADEIQGFVEVIRD